MEEVNVVILCGGKGTRLGPLGQEIPKGLIKINNTPILHRTLELYSKGGFNKFMLCIGYKGHMIKDYFKDKNDFNIRFSDSGEDASMLKRIYDTKDLVGENIFVVYGDTYADINLKDLLINHKSSKCLATMVTTKIKNPWGLIKIDDSDKITVYEEKPVLNYYMGILVINKEAFKIMSKEMLEAKNEEGIVLFFKELVRLGELNNYSHEGLHITFNTHLEKELANNIFEYYTYIENDKK